MPRARPSPTYASAAAGGAGYSDQAHFGHEFRAFTGLTPTRHAEVRRRFFASMYASVSVDGFIADENDQPGPLFDWLTSGDVPLDESGVVKVSQTSYDYTRPYWDQIGTTISGRHVCDVTDGWDGSLRAGSTTWSS